MTARGGPPEPTPRGDSAPALADRVRAYLHSGETPREVRMFGGLSFMLADRMVVAVGGDEDLLVRVDPARDAELIAVPGATRAEMGSGRSMGEGWIRVEADALRTATSLAFWMDAALEYNVN